MLLPKGYFIHNTWIIQNYLNFTFLIWISKIQIRFKFDSNSIQIQFKFNSNSIQIQFKFDSNSIQFEVSNSSTSLISTVLYFLLISAFYYDCSKFLFKRNDYKNNTYCVQGHSKDLRYVSRVLFGFTSISEKKNCKNFFHDRD